MLVSFVDNEVGQTERVKYYKLQVSSQSLGLKVLSTPLEGQDLILQSNGVLVQGSHESLIEVSHILILQDWRFILVSLH